MRFERLRLAGFKSFVDPTELLIGAGLTGIVGPNGCGKSNLLEALRWVMGEGSAKALRGGAMDDVIFAGTASRPPRGLAEVGLFGEHDGRELEVVRRIERGAGSAYRIDGRDARARDVQLLFADSSTGAHSPALVGQGRIAAIIAAKPAERRQMLEEAAGIAGLHVRRRDAELKLRATEANLGEAGQAIDAAATRAQALERQARAAERYRRVGAAIRVAEARLLFARWREADRAAAQAAIETEDAEARVTATTARLTTARAVEHDAAAARETARAGAEAARARDGGAGHALATLRAEHGAAERRIAEIDRALAALADDRDREDALSADAGGAIARIDRDLATLAAAIADADRQAPTLAARRAAAERSARDAEVALAQTRAAHAAASADVRIARAAHDAAADRLRRIEAEIAALARERNALGDRAPLETALATALDAVARAERDGRRHADARDAAEAARGVAAAARDDAERARATAQAEAAAIAAEMAALERGLAHDGAERLIDRLRVEPGAEPILAAALGDDLDRPAAAFADTAPRPGDPPLPPGSRPLATLVDAPALARRLAQIGVVDRDDGAPLAVGQRLVTRDGRMRRWDGLTTAPGGDAVAVERLARANRLRALGAAAPEAQAAAARADGLLATATAALAEADARIAAVRAAIDEAARAERTARRDADAAALAIERLRGRRAALDERSAALSQALKQARADLATAVAAAAALPPLDALGARLDQHIRSAEAAQADVARIIADDAAKATLRADQRTRLARVTTERADWDARAATAGRRSAELAARGAALDADRTALVARVPDCALAVERAEADMAAARVEAAVAEAATRAGEAAHRAAAAETQTASDALGAAREARAGAAARGEAAATRRTEIGRIAGERFASPAPLLPDRLGFAPDMVGDPTAESAGHEKLIADRERLGPVNLVAEAELAELRAALDAQTAERDELARAVAALRGAIGALNREGRQRLLAAFEAVDTHFRRLFATLFEGGEAHLTLIDDDDPLEAGLEIMAQPPGKRLGSLSLLSGGEQALTAVALIFALFLTAPAPVCVLDEVDAPLDDANIERFCDLLDRMAAETETRYLIVTHNAVTMARMHRLYGVTMVERGVSRLVSVDLGAAEALMAAE